MDERAKSSRYKGESTTTTCEAFDGVVGGVGVSLIFKGTRLWLLAHNATWIFHLPSGVRIIDI